MNDDNLDAMTGLIVGTIAGIALWCLVIYLVFCH